MAKKIFPQITQITQIDIEKKSFVHSLRKISDFVVEKIFPQITQITQIDIHKKSFVHSLRRISDFMARKNIPADHADHAD
ncbi:hypothetical protein [Chryseobacterium koreense]|uniref:Uncharacterized protein n=1 Tax=Chryseobacterium koreense CCUG 49689 TaxID=1304281 RepID=A0A0J7IVW6_9FLAO|nr:hypothetical protein [Chryseobacterium koreense]KMQ70443.1 hypothetical protein ACM44_12060 [Chryseobacterium koreense CCUG 49689]MBB5334423.1 hypothetical protein [Chryseobacterium koreense]